jgi:hypothetical protein
MPVQCGAQDQSNETRGPGMVRPSPVVLEIGAASGGHKAVDVSCGDTHTGTRVASPLTRVRAHVASLTCPPEAILLDDGAVFMVGSVHFTGIKAGNVLYSDMPVLVRLTRDPKSVERLGRIVKVRCGGEHTLALTEYGVLLAWGNGTISSSS